MNAATRKRQESVRRRLWLAGHTWASIAYRLEMHRVSMSQWGQRTGRASNAPPGHLHADRRPVLRLHMAEFRRLRQLCEGRGVDREQLDALEPFLADPGEPDPVAPMTTAQHAAVMALADVHDVALWIVQGPLNEVVAYGRQLEDENAERA